VHQLTGFGGADPQTSLPAGRRRSRGLVRSSTSKTPPQRRSPRSSGASGVSTTSWTTTPRRCGSSCRCCRARLGPRHRGVARWLGRLAAGETATVMMTDVRGASNAKAKRDLGWRLRYPSWRGWASPKGSTETMSGVRGRGHRAGGVAAPAPHAAAGRADRVATRLSVDRGHPAVHRPAAIGSGPRPATSANGAGRRRSQRPGRPRRGSRLVPGTR
jgi:hypothetical protein